MAAEISESDPLVASDEEAVMAHYLTGKPIDPEVVERVHARAQAIREETFRKHGLVDIAVPAIRELRGELPS
jgi:hypothetical protein